MAAGGVSDTPPVTCRSMVSSSRETAEVILDWDFDTIAIHNISGGRSISFVTERIFTMNRDITQGRGQVVEELLNVFKSAERSYNPTVMANSPSYHNGVHGADVAQAFHYLCHPLWRNKRPNFTLFAASIFAAVLHDYDHLGVSNNFLASTGHPLATEYGSASVLEKHHCAAAFALMDQMVFGLDPRERKEFKKIVTQMILSTDLANHLNLITQVATLDGTSVDSLCLLLHGADLSSCARPWHVASRWTDRIMEEFFAQGDEERLRGFPTVSPMMDRNACNIPRVQMGFIDVIARPLIVMVVGTTGDHSNIIEELDKNRSIWSSISTE